METTRGTLRPGDPAPGRDLAAIDWLRGLAALGVAVFHVRVALWIGWREIQAHPESYSAFERAVAWLSAPAPFLGSLVMLFFIVSGFCVHLPQVGGRDRLRLRPYLVRRFLRVFPPYLAAVVLTVLIARPAGGEPVVGSVFMVQNYTAGRQLAANPALWSLPVEMELYLAYPIVVWLARCLGWGKVLAGVAVVSLVAVAAEAGGIAVLGGNFALYWIIWCGGAWLAETWSRGTLRRPPRWLGVAAVLGAVAGVFLTLRPLGGGLGNHAWGLFYFWLVWILLACPKLVAAVPAFADRALRALGRISYSLYLIHFPVLLWLGTLWTERAGGKPRNFLVALAACVLVVPVAWLFHFVVEGPSHRLARRLARAAAVGEGKP